MSKLERAINSKFKTKITTPNITYGTLGNGLGIVRVPNRTNYVYVKLVNDKVIEAFNSRVQAVYGLPVRLGIDPLDPGIFQVLSVQSSIADSAGLEISDNGYAPAKRYRWMADGGGQDPLFVEMRQFLPVRLGVGTSYTVNIYPGFIHTTNNEWKQVDYQEVDLSSYVPTASGSSLFVLVGLNSSGTYELAIGDETPNDVLAISDIPEPSSTIEIVLGAVRLYTGQTQIYEGRSNTDIVDLRFPMWHKHPPSDLLGDDFMTKAIYDTNDDGIVDNSTYSSTASVALSVDWDDIVNRPPLNAGILYLHNELSGITGSVMQYESLFEYPANSSEDSDTQSVVLADGEVLIDGYITDELNTTVLPGGTWTFYTYGRVSNAVGVSEIVIRVYKRSNVGVETELFNTTTDEINATSATLYTVETTQNDFIIVATDRLLVKYFAKTSTAASVDVTLYYEGTSHYSRINTPFSVADISGNIMYKSVYDTNNDGIVDSANAVSIQGIGVGTETPSNGQALVYSATGSVWTPGDVASGIDLFPKYEGEISLISGSVLVTDDTYHNGFPGICTISSGELLLVYRKATTHAPSKGTIVKKTSSDDGATWSSETTIINDATYDVREPQITKLLNNNIVLVYCKYSTDNGGLAGDQVYLKISDDDGATWGSEINIETNFTARSYTSAPVIELPNGNLLLSIYGLDTGDTYYSSEIYISSDGGSTWVFSYRVADGETDSKAYSEPNLVLCKNGQILCLIRCDTPDQDSGNFYASWSNDFGVSWSSPSSVLEATGRPTVICLSSGILLCIYRARTTYEARYTISKDNGNNWSASVLLWESVVRSSYAFAVEYEPGLVGAALGDEDANTDSNIIFVTFYLSQYTGQVVSTVPSGIPPLVVESIALVNNLNADLLDGQHGSYYMGAGEILMAEGEATATPLSNDEDTDWLYEG